MLIHIGPHGGPGGIVIDLYVDISEDGHRRVQNCDPPQGSALIDEGEPYDFGALDLALATAEGRDSIGIGPGPEGYGALLVDGEPVGYFPVVQFMPAVEPEPIGDPGPDDPQEIEVMVPAGCSAVSVVLSDATYLKLDIGEISVNVSVRTCDPTDPESEDVTVAEALLALPV